MRALVIGGGIAGPVAALALQRAGVEAIICEARAWRADDIGSYLTVATNGLDALHAVDAREPVLSAGFPTNHVVLSSGTGKRLARGPIGRTRPDESGSITIKRAHLHRALRELVMIRGIGFEFGRRLTGVVSAEDGVVVASFEDGTQTGADLLVGCDGVHSTTRRIIDPSAPTGRYVGLVNYGGYTPGLTVPSEPGSWHMVFGRHAFFGYTADRAGGIVWFANVPRSEVGRSGRNETSLDGWKR